MKIIEPHNLKKVYNSTVVPVQALNNVSLSFSEGEFTVIVGPSGSGKTTLLNMLGGLDKPTSGEVFIDGVDITGMKESKLNDFLLHNIGLVFQSYNLLPVLTARENVSFIMLLQKEKKEVVEQRAEELLRQVGLEDKMDVRPSKLSGGQQQRVAVARALASRPRFILADESTPTWTPNRHSTYWISCSDSTGRRGSP